MEFFIKWLRINHGNVFTKYLPTDLYGIYNNLTPVIDNAFDETFKSNPDDVTGFELYLHNQISTSINRYSLFKLKEYVVATDGKLSVSLIQRLRLKAYEENSYPELIPGSKFTFRIYEIVRDVIRKLRLSLPPQVGIFCVNTDGDVAEKIFKGIESQNEGGSQSILIIGPNLRIIMTALCSPRDNIFIEINNGEYIPVDVLRDHLSKYISIDDLIFFLSFLDDSIPKMNIFSTESGCHTALNLLISSFPFKNNQSIFYTDDKINWSNVRTYFTNLYPFEIKEISNLSGIRKLNFSLYRYDYYRSKGITNEDLEEMTHNYLHVVLSVFNQMIYGFTDKNLFYKFHYPPLVVDIPNLTLNEFEIKKDTGRYSLYDQILAILPIDYKYLLPDERLNNLMEEGSPIAEVYPVAFNVDISGGSDIPLINFVSIPRISRINKIKYDGESYEYRGYTVNERNLINFNITKGALEKIKREESQPIGFEIKSRSALENIKPFTKTLMFKQKRTDDANKTFEALERKKEATFKSMINVISEIKKPLTVIHFKDFNKYKPAKRIDTENLLINKLTKDKKDPEVILEENYESMREQIKDYISKSSISESYKKIGYEYVSNLRDESLGDILTKLKIMTNISKEKYLLNLFGNKLEDEDILKAFKGKISEMNPKDIESQIYRKIFGINTENKSGKDIDEEVYQYLEKYAKGLTQKELTSFINDLKDESIKPLPYLNKLRSNKK